MKKLLVLLLLSTFLFGCKQNNNESISASSLQESSKDSQISSNEFESSINLSSNEDSSSLGSSVDSTIILNESSLEDSSSFVSTSQLENTSSISSLVSNTSSVTSTSLSTSSISNISSSSINDETNPIPGNINDKYLIGNDNKSMTSFSFIDTLPDYFRFIYGYKYLNKADRYANGEVKISSSNNAKQGIQTGMFESNLKLEIRLEIGQINNCSAGNKIEKDKPVVEIKGFDDTGDYLRSVFINQINKSNENSSINVYMDGTNVSYLEIRFVQLPYKGSQAYNIGLKGISLIAWPYALK